MLGCRAPTVLVLTCQTGREGLVPGLGVGRGTVWKDRPSLEGGCCAVGCVQAAVGCAGR